MWSFFFPLLFLFFGLCMMINFVWRNNRNANAQKNCKEISFEMCDDNVNWFRASIPAFIERFAQWKGSFSNMDGRHLHRRRCRWIANTDTMAEWDSLAWWWWALSTHTFICAKNLNNDCRSRHSLIVLIDIFQCWLHGMDSRSFVLDNLVQCGLASNGTTNTHTNTYAYT